MERYTENPKLAYEFLGDYIGGLNQDIQNLHQQLRDKSQQQEAMAEELKQKHLKIVDLSREIMLLRQQLYDLQYK